MTPSTTLFSYTTRFRSRHDKHQNAEHVAVDAAFAGEGEEAEAAAKQAQDAADHHQDCDDAQGPVRIAGCLRCRDRKSTRLNSSHLVISYAVFCLKTTQN